MLHWIYSLWYTENSNHLDLAGPARYAPNGGLNIKSILDERNRLLEENNIGSKKNTPPPPPPPFVKKRATPLPKPEKPSVPSETFIIITEKDILEAKKGLKPIPSNPVPSKINSSPLKLEFDAVFEMGADNYFSGIKKKRSEKKLF
jgi:hypothetical protein